MPDFLLRDKLKSLCASNATLLWLEGARHERVLGVKISGKRLVIQLANGTTRVMLFERFAVTSVGLQFWSQGRPGVLYKWDQVPKTHAGAALPQDGHSPDGDGTEPPTPPDMAA